MNRDALLEPRFKRNQMEWALWYSFHQCLPDKKTPLKIPITFSNRIKKLLDLDSLSEFTSNTRAQHAFHTTLEKGPGKNGNGTDKLFSMFDTFLLGVALSLMNQGTKQGDALLLFQGSRHKLADPLLTVIDYLDAAFPGHTHYEVRGPKADQIPGLPAFFVFHRVEIKEVFIKNHPSSYLIYDPAIAYDWRGLTRLIARYLPLHNHASIIEFSKLAFDIRVGLQKAPIISRGRKPADTPSLLKGSKK